MSKQNKNWWDSKTENAQGQYLGQHPKSKLNMRRLLDNENEDLRLDSFSDFKQINELLKDDEIQTVTIKGSFLMYIEFLSNKLNRRKEFFNHNNIVKAISDMYNVNAERVALKDFQLEIKLMKTETRFRDLSASLTLFETGALNKEELSKNLQRVARIEALQSSAHKALFALSELTDGTMKTAKQSEQLRMFLNKHVNDILNRGEHLVKS